MHPVLPSLVACLLIAAVSAAEPGRLSFTMETPVAGNPTVTVEVAWPVGADGKPSPEARDIAYYAPFWCEDRFATDHGVFEAMAAHFTVVGVFLDDRRLPAGAKPSWDPSSGSLDAILAAVAEVRRRLALPPGRMLACGHSSGATLLYWAARARPGVFEAIAPIAGRAPPLTRPLPLPTLHVLTFGDDRVEDALAWHRLQSQAGWSTMLTTDPRWEARDNPIWLHLNSSESIVLAVDWLRAVADLRATHGGVLPAPADWPEQAPAAAVAATGEPGPAGIRSFPVAGLAKRFTAVHRRIRHAEGPDGVSITRVTPLGGSDRTVVVLVDPARGPEEALHDAILVAGKGADAIAVQATSAPAAATAVADLIAQERERRPASPCAVIADATHAAALAGLPAGVLRLALDPQAPVAPGTMVVAAAGAGLPDGAVPVAGPFSSPAVRHVRLLTAACGLVAAR